MNHNECWNENAHQNTTQPPWLICELSWASLILCPIEHGLAYAWDCSSCTNYKKHRAYGLKPHIIHANLKEDVGHEDLCILA